MQKSVKACWQEALGNGLHGGLGSFWGCILRAVLVRVDREVDTAACSLCSVAGVELSAAPRRPPAFRRCVHLPACAAHLPACACTCALSTDLPPWRPKPRAVGLRCVLLSPASSMAMAHSEPFFGFHD